MTRQEIELKIKVLEKMLSRESDCSTLATINRCIEKLVMMEADESEYEERRPSDEADDHSNFGLM